MQHSVIIAHRQLDDMEASGISLESEKDWQDKLAKAQERAEKRKEQLASMMTGDTLDPVTAQNALLEQMREYDAKKKAALEKAKSEGKFDEKRKYIDPE